MRLILSKTFGGLSTKYYLRQLVFGIGFLIPIIFGAIQNAFTVDVILFSLINTFLYPYARFVYEQIAGFILGNNIFIINMKFLMIFKLMTMVLCWTMAIIIAPFGLGYLYYLNDKKG